MLNVRSSPRNAAPIPALWNCAPVIDGEIFGPPRHAMNAPLTRRTFLKTTTAASALAFPAVMRAQTPDTPTPNNRLNVAIIGAGGRGAAAVQGMKDENVVAI